MSTAPSAPSVRDQARAREWKVMRHRHFGRVGDPYLDRTILIGTPWFGVYLHHIWREDRDDFPHDHPWPFVGIVLTGGYVEDVYADPGRHRLSQVREVIRRRWSVRRVPRGEAHRITSIRPGTRTLVLRGRHHGEWGFWTTAGWVLWSDYLAVAP